jgi:hypothetical protein
MRKLLILPLTLPLAAARGAVSGAFSGAFEALVDALAGPDEGRHAAPPTEPPLAPPPPPAPPRAAPPPPTPPRAASPPPPVEPVTDEPTRAEVGRRRVAQREAEGGGPGGVGAEVHIDEPWDGYARMTAPEVVERLVGADEATRAVVRLYEAANRNRTTVLRATET